MKRHQVAFAYDELCNGDHVAPLKHNGRVQLDGVRSGHGTQTVIAPINAADTMLPMMP